MIVLWNLQITHFGIKSWNKIIKLKKSDVIYDFIWIYNPNWDFLNYENKSTKISKLNIKINMMHLH
jgi:hypothetical protein